MASVIKSWAVVLGTEKGPNGFVQRIWLADVYEWEDQSWANSTAADRDALSKMSGDKGIEYVVVQWFSEEPPYPPSEYGTSVLD